MSRRTAKGTDTALVKAIVAFRKHPGSEAARDRWAAERGARVNIVPSALSLYAMSVGQRGRPKAARLTWDEMAGIMRRDARARTRLLRRVAKKLGQPFRKNMDRKRMKRRAAGKNEVHRHGRR